MNHIYRRVWSQRLGAFVVVSEATRSNGKSGGVVKAVAAAALLASGGAYAQATTALPTGGQVSAGQAVITTQGNAMTITQGTQRTAINWQSFNIGKDALVQFAQPNANAVALNRVVGNEASAIQGALRANGKVYLVNPNGVLFGAHSRVDVGSLVASTRALSDTDFMAGKAQFGGQGEGRIVNQGVITAADGGYVALIGRGVRNDGVITARLGTVAAGAGDKVSLNFNGDSLVGLAIDQGTLNALVDNQGAVRADGGQILLSAKTASALLDAVVNNAGELRAQTIAERNGRILLLADAQHGQAQVSGTLDASAPQGGDGGFIETSAAKVRVQDGTRVTTAAGGGHHGRWLIDPTDFVVAASGGDISGTTLGSNLGSGDVEIQSASGAGGTDGKVIINDAVSWSANRLTLNAQGNIEINDNLTGSGTAALTLKYGQSSVAAGNTGSYSLLAGKTVDLPAGQSLTLNRGSDGVDDVYTVITSLGTASSTAATDLQGIADAANLGGHYALGADINASATNTWNPGQIGYLGFRSIGNTATPFTGQFEGLGHTISGLRMRRSATDDGGLFGAVAAGSRLGNVNLTSLYVLMNERTGGLVGSLAGTVENVSVSGSVSGQSRTGGVVGWVQSTATVRNASTGTLALFGAGLDIGGVVGLNDGTVQAITTGAGTSVGAEGDHVGGLIGRSSVALADLTSHASVDNTGTATGGLVGLAEAPIVNGVATGNVLGVSRVGGLVGETNASATVTGSQASGTVSGTDTLGGLVGMAAATIGGSSASGDVTGVPPISNPGAPALSDIGGLVGTTTALVTSSSASGLVDGSMADGMTNVGGLIGSTSGDVSTVSVAAPNGVTGNRVLGGLHVGGVVGLQTAGMFSGATSTVDVLGVTDVGGVVGYQTSGFGFGSVSSTGSVTGVDHVGGVAGVSAGATAIFATGAVSGETNVGGVVGELLANGVLSSSWATGSVSGTSAGTAVGGLVGLNNGEVKNIDMLDPNNSNAQIVQTVSGVTRVGGLVGDNQGLVRQSAVYNSVSGTSAIGGIAGYNALTVASSTVAGSVNGSTDTGGAVGTNAATGTVGTITATATVGGGTNTGGAVGNNSGSVTGTTASGDVSGGAVTGGLVGYNNSVVNQVSATGNVASGGSTLGGLVGRNDTLGQITNATATGNVNNGGNDHDIGGLVGLNNGSIANAAASGNVRGWDRVGGLVGSSNGNITDSTAGIVNGVSAGSVTGNTARRRTSTDVGGLVGKLYGTAAVLRGTASVPVYGTWYVGGLVGDMYDTTSVTDSSASGAVQAVWNSRGDDAYAVGGLVGSSAGSISGSFATGNVTGGARADYVGGLVGDHYEVLTNSYATGVVTGRDGVGGLVGYINPPDQFGAAGSITNSYATGAVSGSSQVGGLAGYVDVGSTITTSHATGSVTGGSQVGGLVGVLDGSHLSASYASGAVIGTGENVGGLVGVLDASNDVAGIESSTSSSSVTGGANVGGLVGHIVSTATLTGASGIVTSTGAVQGGTAVGGLVGLTDVGVEITNASSSGAVSGTDRVGGLIGDNGATLSGTTNSTTSAVTGLSGGTGGIGAIVGFNGGTVEQFTASNAVGGAADRTGGLVGQNEGIVQNSSATQAVSTTGGDTGGAIGMNSGAGQALHVVASGAVSGALYVGGLIGENQGLVADSRATGTVMGAGTVGGFVGTNLGEIVRSYATGAVTGAASAVSVGGFAGDNTGTISTAYATGAVVGDTAAGGFIGTLTTMFTPGSLSDVYATGSVTGADKVGGLVGDAASGTIDHAYASGAVTAAGANVGGFAGSGGSTITHAVYETTGTGLGTSIGSGAQVAQGKSATEIKTGAAFADWSNLSTAGGAGLTWRLYEGDARPLLMNWLTPLVISANAPVLSYVYDGVVHRDAVPSVTYTETLTAGHLNGSARYHDVLNAGSTNQLVGHWSDQQGYDVSYVHSGTLTVTPRQLSASLVAVTKAYDGNATVALAANDFSLSGFVNGEGALVTRTVGTLNSANVVGASSVTTTLSGDDFSATGGTLLSNYSLPSSAGGAATVTPKAITFTGTTVNGKVYDGNTQAQVATGSVQGLVGSETLAIGSSGTFDSKNAGPRSATVHYTLANGSSGGLASNYAAADGAVQATITPRALTVGFNVASRAYDGTTAASVTTTDDRLPGDQLALSYSSAFSNGNAGADKPVTISQLLLQGADAGNYVPETGSATGTITPRQLSITGSQVVARAYDGTAVSSVSTGALQGLVGAESISVSGQALFENVHAGTHPATVVYVLGNGTSGGLASNYALPTEPLPALITPKLLTISGTVASGKVYDGTTVAQVTRGTVQGLVGAETLGVVAAGVFDSKNAGERSATVHYTLANGSNGGLASDYTIADTTAPATITPRALSIGFNVASRAYDGTTAATVTATDDRLPGDQLAISYSSAFGNGNAGQNKPVAISQLALQGADAGNYVPEAGSATGTITPRQLTITGSQVVARAYDGTAVSSVSTGTLQGLVGTESVGVSGQAQFENAHVGTHTATVVYGLANGTGGGLASNYALPAELLPALVTPKLLTISGTVAAGKVYDGTTAAQVVPGTLQGLVGNESLNVSAAGTFDSKNAGSRTATARYTLANGTGTGGLASDYTIAESTGLQATITPRELVLVFDVATRQYDTTTAAQATVQDNRVSGDTLQFGYTASFADINAGARKAVTVSGFTVTGADAANYTPVLTPATGDVQARTIGFTLAPIEPNKTRTANGAPQLLASELDKLVTSTWVNAVGTEVPGTLSYSLWSNGVQVTQAVLPGVYEVRAVFTPANANYASAAGNVKWPTFALAPAAMPEVISAAQRTATVTPVVIQPPSARNADLLGATQVNVVAAPQQIVAAFGEGSNLRLVGAPNGNESTQAVNMTQAAAMLGMDAAAAGTDVRVPLGRNSLVSLVNGGVKLPDQVDQLLFVVGDSNKGERGSDRDNGKDQTPSTQRRNGGTGKGPDTP